MAKQQLEIGDLAPEFELQDQDGKLHRLSMYKGNKIVIYFYPRDDTPGCTAEARGMKENFDKFRSAGMVVLGVSADSVDSHKRFAQKYALPFTLLSNESHDVIEKYGAWENKGFLSRMIPSTKRTTFVVDEHGKIMKIYPKVKPAEHAEEILRDVGA